MSIVQQEHEMPAEQTVAKAAINLQAAGVENATPETVQCRAPGR